MANRNAKLIERALKDFSLGVMEGGEGGTTVIANPELSGDEAELTGLQVGDTKYAVPQGGGTEFYRHIIDFYGNDPTACTSGYIRVEIFNNQALGYTFETFVQYLIDNNYTISSNNHFPCFTGEYGQAYIDKCYVDNQNPSEVTIVTDVTIYRANNETTFSDTVLPFVVPVND